MSSRSVWRVAIGLAATLLAAACGVEAPWVARSDLVEVVLDGAEVSIDVTGNDTLSGAAQLMPVASTSPDLEIRSDIDGVVTARSVGGAVGDEHHLRYRVRAGDRSTDGTLVVRIVEGPESDRRLVVRPTEVDFGTVAVSSVAIESVSVSVAGTGDDVFSIVVEKADPSATTIEHGRCEDVSERRPCELSVQWSPTEVGVLEQTIEIRADGLESQSIALVGTASSTAFELEPESIDFGTVLLGAEAPSRDITIRNTGSTPISPRVDAVPAGLAVDATGCGVVVSGGECDLVVELETDETTTIEGVLTISADGGGSESIEIAGRVITRPRATSFDLSRDSFTIVGADGVEVVRIENTGETMLTGFEVAGAPVWITAAFAADCESLAVGEECELTFDFARDVDASEDDVAVSVTANGVDRTIAVTVDPLASIELDPADVVLTGTNPVETIVVTNTGDVAIAEVGLPGLTDDTVVESIEEVVFENVSCDSELEPGARCEFMVRAVAGVLDLESYDARRQFEVSADGVVELLSVTVDIDSPPEFDLSPGLVVLLDDGASAMVTLTNTGEIVIDDVVVTAPAGFGPAGDGELTVVEGDCSEPVDLGSDCSFELIMTEYPSDPPFEVEVPVVANGVRSVVTVRLIQVVR